MVLTRGILDQCKQSKSSRMKKEICGIGDNILLFVDIGRASFCVYKEERMLCKLEMIE